MDKLDVLLILASAQQTQAYHHLETLCLCYPGRSSGSDILESALDFLFQLGSEKMGLPTVYAQEVVVPNWVRGKSDEEKLVFDIVAPEGVWPVPNPARRVVSILATGMSPGTTTCGTSGPLISVASPDELRNCGDVKGKIVLMDFRSFSTYFEMSRPIRSTGAIEASKVSHYSPWTLVVLLVTVCDVHELVCVLLALFSEARSADLARGALLATASLRSGIRAV